MMMTRGIKFDYSGMDEDIEDLEDSDYSKSDKQRKSIEYLQQHPRQFHNQSSYQGISAIQIDMSGTSRNSDNQTYIKNGGQIPVEEYEIHHNGDMEKNGNGIKQCTMIALPTTYHNSIKPHWGAVCQYRAKYGGY